MCACLAAVVIVNNKMEGVVMTATANASVTAYAQVEVESVLLPTHIAQVTNQITFAPTAPSQKLILKSWERQPSTPFLARHKSRKIWKRFRRSMEALRGRRMAVAASSNVSCSSRIEESDFAKEISQSANAAYFRAVKRQRLRLVLHDGDNDSNSNSKDHVNVDIGAKTERGRSFLETKWELEMGRRKRKMAAVPYDLESEEQLVVDGHNVENEAGCNDGARSLEEIPRHVRLHTTPEAVGVENSASEAEEEENNDDDDDDENDEAIISEIVNLVGDAPPGDGTAVEVRGHIAKQDTTLVRSALRMNSLDGDDAALLSEFLSRAQAKRAANAAMVSNGSKHVIRKGAGNEIRERQDEQQQVVSVALNSPAVQSRRALEELNVNSPSIQNKATSTPAKADRESGSPGVSEPVEDKLIQTSSPTVTRRRSSRTKHSSRPQQARSVQPTVPNQIPVRRPNGTEFVFLQRTEAQELALTTRKNTRRNKGNSISPKYLLQAMGRHELNEQVVPTEGKDEKSAVAPEHRRSPCKPGESKKVWWRDDKLVEFAPEKTLQSLDSPSPRRKKSSTSGREESRAKQDTATAMHALPATPSKKVRKINMVAMNGNNNTTAMADAVSAPSSKPLAAGTPIPKRKKLTPRVPKDSSILTTTTFAVAATSTTERPSHLAYKTSILSAIAATKQSSTASSTQQSTQKASGIPRSKTLIKAPASSTSSAGAAPVVKRVRARRAAV